MTQAVTGSLLPVATLTFAAFAIGTTEFAVQGVLPEIATDLGASIPSVGLLVTGYALGVALGGPLLAIVTSGLRRKTALLVLLAIFVLGHVLCATAPSYAMLLLARVVASLCHGALMGIGLVVAVGIAPEERRAAAVALMWAGIASANILGVPAGTALGQAFGWRATFWAIAGLGVVAALLVALWLPNTGRGKTGLASEFRVLGKRQVLLVLAMSGLVCAATFSVFTYIAPLLAGVTGIAPGALPIYLLAFGIGGVSGMQVGGRFADRNPMAAIPGAFVADAVVYLILLFAFRSFASALPMMFVWGFAFYFIAAPLQLRLVDSAREAPNLASTVLQSAFNLGIALGPFVGGFVLSSGLGLACLPICGALLAATGAAVALWSAALDRAPRALTNLPHA